MLQLQNPTCDITTRRRTHRGVRWHGLFSFLLCGMLQEAKRNEELTRVSQNMDRLCFESEGDRGNIMYSVFDSEWEIRYHPKRVETEWMMTKVEKMPCSTQFCLHSTFRQEHMRGRLMLEGTRSTNEVVELVGSDSLVRFGALLNCVVVLGKEKERVLTTDVVRCTCLLDLVCCVRVVRCSSSPKFLCVPKNIYIDVLIRGIPRLERQSAFST